MFPLPANIFYPLFSIGIGFVRLFLLRILLIEECPTSTKFEILSSPHPVLFLMESMLPSISGVIL